MGQVRLLLDSDILVAAYKADDSNHERAVGVLANAYQGKVVFSVTNLVVQESATVISYQMGMDDARKYYLGIFSIAHEVIDVEAKLASVAWEVFLRQTKKGTSFVDCGNVAVIEGLKLDGILSFDGFYPKELTEWKRE